MAERGDGYMSENLRHQDQFGWGAYPTRMPCFLTYVLYVVNHHQRSVYRNSFFIGGNQKPACEPILPTCGSMIDTRNPVYRHPPHSDAPFNCPATTLYRNCNNMQKRCPVATGSASISTCNSYFTQNQLSLHSTLLLCYIGFSRDGLGRRNEGLGDIAAVTY